MFNLKHLFTLGTVFMFLSMSGYANLFAQNCPEVSRKSDSTTAENRQRQKPEVEREAVIVEEKVTISDRGEDLIEEEVIVTRRRSVHKVAIPEHAVKEAARARKAAEVIEHHKMNMKNAEAIAVFPNVVKGALGWGGRWGKGLLTRRDKCGNWMAPSFVNITGASFGFQVGVEATDLVLVFTSADAVDAVLGPHLELGGDATGAIGPLGRRAAIGTDILLKSGVYSFSKTKGLFIGVALHGATITIDDSSNEHAYSQHVHGDEILKHPQVRMNVVVQPFVDALNEYAPPKDARTVAVADPSSVAVADPSLDSPSPDSSPTQ